MNLEKMLLTVSFPGGLNHEYFRAMSQGFHGNSTHVEPKKF